MRSFVALFRTPTKGISIDPNATEGAVVGENLWIREADGSLSLFQPTSGSVTTTSGVTTVVSLTVNGVTQATSSGGSNSAYSPATSPYTPQTNYDLDLAAIAGFSSAFPTLNYVLVGDGANWKAVPMTGDVTIVASGATLVNQAHLTDQAVPTPPADGLILRSFDQQGFSVAHVYDAQGNDIELTRDNLDIVRNTTGGTLAKGTVVYFTGTTTGSVGIIAKAKADAAATMPAVGVLYESIANNAYGRMIFGGHLESIDLSAFSNGDLLYVSATTAGALTNVQPTTFPQSVGYVVNNGVGNGVMHVALQNRPLVNWDYSSYTAKTTPVAADLLLLADSAASNQLKKILYSDLSAAIAATVTSTPDAIFRISLAGGGIF